MKEQCGNRDTKEGEGGRRKERPVSAGRGNWVW
jgi:hypothetical protein